jgi:hypothetical protein
VGKSLSPDCWSPSRDLTRTSRIQNRIVNHSTTTFSDRSCNRSLNGKTKVFEAFNETTGMSNDCRMLYMQHFQNATQLHWLEQTREQLINNGLQEDQSFEKLTVAQSVRILFHTGILSTDRTCIAMLREAAIGTYPASTEITPHGNALQSILLLPPPPPPHQLCLGVTSVRFPSRLRTKILYVFFMSRFEISGSGDRLTWLRLFMVFLSPSRRTPG